MELGRTPSYPFDRTVIDRTPSTQPSHRIRMGELLSLMTALLWAFGVVLFKKSVSFVPPFALSVFKAIIAFVLMAATTVVVGQAHAISISPAYLMIILTRSVQLPCESYLYSNRASRLNDLGLTRWRFPDSSACRSPETMSS